MKIRICVFLCIFLAITSRVKSDDSVSRSQWSRLPELQGVRSEKEINSPSIYVFFDSNCAASARLLSTQVLGRPFADQDAVWIPVSYMSKSSMGKAVSILRNQNFSSIKKNFMNFNFKHSLGAVKQVVPDREEVARMNYSNEVWRSFGSISATPMIVYQDKAGVAHIHLGYNPPEELERIVNEASSSRMQEYK